MWLWLFACEDEVKTDDTDTGVVEQTYIDEDGDGYTIENDCDDSNADINPQADELCDDVDNDCDGEIDEEVGDVFYADSDEDGFGDPEELQYFCDAPTEEDDVSITQMIVMMPIQKFIRKQMSCAMRLTTIVMD